jgi:hypothetical protein
MLHASQRRRFACARRIEKTVLLTPQPTNVGCSLVGAVSSIDGCSSVSAKSCREQMQQFLALPRAHATTRCQPTREAPTCAGLEAPRVKGEDLAALANATVGLRTYSMTS